MSRDDHISEGELVAFNLGELPDDAVVRIVEHLERCTICETRARRFDGVVDPLMAGFRLPAAEAPAASVKRCQAAETQRGLPEPEKPALPGYEILEELGRGSMGVVYKARQHSPTRVVALKRVVGSVDDNLVRFCREGEAAARLQHANLVQVYEIGWHDGLPFLAMEYVSGGSLKTLLHDGLLEPRRAAGMAATVAFALEVVHQNRIVHRDLKPANILLTRSGVPKISDFGLAKSLDSEVKLTQQGMMVGTPCYMSPEQVREGDEVGPGSDIHGLGVLLYEMLTGRVPFEGPSSAETLQLILSREPIPPGHLQPGLPRDLETICLKCLHKEPARRYATAAALGEDLNRFLEGKPIQARPAPRRERAWKWVRRRPVLAALMAAVILVAPAGFAGVVWQWQGAESNARAALAARDDAEARAHLYRAACLALLASQLDVAEDTSQRFLDLAARSHRPDASCLALRVLALLPGARGSSLRALSSRLAAANHLHAGWLPVHAQALAQYRLGQFEEAVRLAQQSLREEATANERALPLDNLVLALACWRLDRKDEARTCLQRAEDWLEQTRKNLPLPEAAVLGDTMVDGLALQLLLVEAKELTTAQR